MLVERSSVITTARWCVCVFALGKKSVLVARLKSFFEAAEEDETLLLQRSEPKQNDDMNKQKRKELIEKARLLTEHPTRGTLYCICLSTMLCPPLSPPPPHTHTHTHAHMHTNTISLLSLLWHYSTLCTVPLDVIKGVVHTKRSNQSQAVLDALAEEGQVLDNMLFCLFHPHSHNIHCLDKKVYWKGLSSIRERI